VTKRNDRCCRHSRASNPEWERILASNGCVLSCSEADEGTFGVGLRGRGSTAHDEIERLGEGDVGKG
jgi:hypothetical protein